MSFHNTSIRVSRPEKSSMSSLISMANMSNKTLKSWDSSGDNGYSSNKKRLKINPDSSLIEMLRKQVKNNKNVNDQISLLFETTTPVLSQTSILYLPNPNKTIFVQGRKLDAINQQAKSEWSTSFLFTMYQYVDIFMVAFAVLIFLFLGSVEGFSTKLQPALYLQQGQNVQVHPRKCCLQYCSIARRYHISIFFGFLGMKITIYANARTTLEARKGVGKAFITAFRYVTFSFLGMKIATYANARTTLEARKGVRKAFITAFRSGAVMGFLIAANGLLVLYITINVFKLYYGDDWEGLFEAITGYVRWIFHDTFWKSGGIYTKAADVGADLVGKIERNIPEGDPRNPAQL
ncbi:hypothetical protein GIB67_030419 [Kingdonia uniflora]|uniref:H(+)-exporting diphosphatase n=1 Tax=Kingdonia uniflora TaxID=39325 RepID=A0A7J7NDL2_9MAGN|nr:hypothetical protein GIB67_030419 [Kingdonia uniflora]